MASALGILGFALRAVHEGRRKGSVGLMCNKKSNYIHIHTNKIKINNSNNSIDAPYALQESVSRSKLIFGATGNNSDMSSPEGGRGSHFFFLKP